MKNKKMKVGAKAGAYSAVLTVIVVAAAIVVNLIVNSLPSKYIKLDTTAESMFTFDEKTEAFIAGLSEDVTVYHIAQEGYEDPYLTEILVRYSDMNSHITVETVDPGKNPTFVEQYTDQSVSNNSLIITGAERSKLVPSTDVYYIWCEAFGGQIDQATFEYYAQSYYYQYGSFPEYSQIFAGENAVASGIDYVTMDDIPKIYLLSGHDEPALNFTLTEWLKLQNYETQQLSLSEENLGLDGGSATVKSVPDDADMVVITGLSRDISEAELSVLTDYVGSGGNLLVLSNYTDANFANFTKLAAAYGIDNNMSLAIETNAASYSSTPHNILAKVSDHSFVAGISNVYLPYSHAMKLSESMPEGMKGSVLLSTSDGAFAKKVGFDTSSNTAMTKQEGDVDGPFALAALVECEGAGNVLWVSSNYYMMTEDRYGTGTGACLVFASAVGNLCGTAETISVHTVELGNSYLNVTEGSASMWGIILIGVIPLAFIGVGFAVWMKRRSN